MPSSPFIRNIWDTVSTPGVNFSAGTLASVRSDIVFSNSNNVTFGLETNGVITAIAAAGTAGAGMALQGSGTFSQNTGTVQFNNSNGVTFGMVAGQITASVQTNYQSAGAYLTTAALSQDSSKYAGTNTSVATTAGTDLTLGVNTSGVTIGYPKWITTYVNDLTSDRAGTNTSVVTTAGTDLSFAVNTSGVTIAYPRWITAATGGGGAGTGFTSTSTAGSNIVGTLDTNGLSVGIPNYLTTAALSQDSSKYAGTNGAITGGSITVNTSGVSINLPAYLTTAALSQDSSKYAGTGTSATNASITLNTAGLAISVAPPAGGATLSFWANLTFGPGLFSFQNASTGSAFRVFPIILPQAVSASYMKAAASFIASSITTGGTSVNTTFSIARTASYAFVVYTQGTGANSLSLQYSTSALASFVFQTSIQAGATGSEYTVSLNITYPILGGYSNTQFSYPVSSGTFNISTTQLTDFTGNKMLHIPFDASLSPGNYWIATGFSTDSAKNAGPTGLSAGNIFNVSWIGVSQLASTWGHLGSANNASNQLMPGHGIWSTNAAILSTSSIRLVDITNEASTPLMLLQFLRQA